MGETGSISIELYEVCERARVSERVCKVNKKCRVKSVESRTKGKTKRVPTWAFIARLLALSAHHTTVHGTRYTHPITHHQAFSIQHSQIKLQPFSLMLVRVQGSLTSSPPQAREHALSKSQAWRTLPCDVLAPGELLLRYFSIEPWDWRT